MIALWTSPSCGAVRFLGASVKDGRTVEGEAPEGETNSKAEHEENKRTCGYLLWGNWQEWVVESISIWFKPQIGSTNGLNKSSIPAFGQKASERGSEWEWEIFVENGRNWLC